MLFHVDVGASRKAKVRAISTGAGSLVDLSGRSTSRTLRTRRSRLRGDLRRDWRNVAADFRKVIDSKAADQP